MQGVPHPVEHERHVVRELGQQIGRIDVEIQLGADALEDAADELLGGLRSECDRQAGQVGRGAHAGGRQGEKQNLRSR